MEFRQCNNNGGHYDGGASRRGGITAQMDDNRYTDQ